MTGNLVHLEDFGQSEGGNLLSEFSSVPSTAGQPQEGSQGYDQGYRAGWEDAVKAEEEDQARITADFARNVQDIGFTFHEARAQVLRSFRPLMEEVVNKLLPEVISRIAGPIAIEELTPLAEEFADAPLEIMVSPETVPATERLLSRIVGEKPRLVAEPSLGPGQVWLRAGQVERRVDLSEVVNRIAAAVDALYQDKPELKQHG